MQGETEVWGAFPWTQRMADRRAHARQVAHIADLPFQAHLAVEHLGEQSGVEDPVTNSLRRGNTNRASGDRTASE